MVGLSDQSTRFIRRHGKKVGQRLGSIFRELVSHSGKLPMGSDYPTVRKRASDKDSSDSAESMISRDGILASGSDDPTWQLQSVGLIGRSNDHGRYFGIQN